MPQEVSEKQLKFGYWFVTHKEMLRTVLLVALLVANIIVWGYIIFSLVVAYGVNFVSHRQMLADIATNRFVNYEGILSISQPQDIRIISIETLKSDEDRVDIMAQVSNPNPKWGAVFNYQFETPQGKTMSKSDFVLPGEEKILLDLDVEATAVLGLNFENVQWSRENNFVELKSLREKFAFNNVQFTPPDPEAGSNFSRVAFEVVNQSSFNYFEPTFQVYLMRGGEVLAVNMVSVEQLLSGESRALEARWFTNLPFNVQDVQIVPNINYLDPKVYLPF